MMVRAGCAGKELTMPYTPASRRSAGVTIPADTGRSPASSSPGVRHPAAADAASAEHLLDEIQAARLLRLSRRTLQGWRFKGGGPPFVRLSRRCIRYRRGDLQAFVVQRMRRSTSDPGADDR
jgi:hypothetical protein